MLNGLSRGALQIFFLFLGEWYSNLVVKKSFYESYKQMLAFEERQKQRELEEKELARHSHGESQNHAYHLAMPTHVTTKFYDPEVEEEVAFQKHQDFMSEMHVNGFSPIHNEKDGLANPCGQTVGLRSLGLCLVCISSSFVISRFYLLRHTPNYTAKIMLKRILNKSRK